MWGTVVVSTKLRDDFLKCELVFVLCFCFISSPSIFYCSLLNSLKSFIVELLF